MATNTFTGSGTYATTARWSLSHVPLITEDIVIGGTVSDVPVIACKSLTLHAFDFSFTGPGSAISTGAMFGTDETETLTIVGKLTLGNCAGSVFTKLVLVADDITTGTIAAKCFNTVTATITGDVITGATVDNWAESSTVTISGDITVGDAAIFATISTLSAVNITTGDITSFATAAAEVSASGNIVTGAVDYFSDTSTVSADNITITGACSGFSLESAITTTGDITIGDVTDFAYQSSTVTVTGDIVTGDCITSFADASTVIAVNITTGDVGVFSKDVATVNAGGDITTGEVTTFATDSIVTGVTVICESVATLFMDYAALGCNIAVTNLVIGGTFLIANLTDDILNNALVADVIALNVDVTQVKAGYLHGTALSAALGPWPITTSAIGPYPVSDTHVGPWEIT
jgi:hypothetical protein